ncbi:MAG: DUF4070 domain-containing protein, partial [Candidatus Thiodiazotropha endolucinida]
GQIFQRTVDWALEMGMTTATFHIQTPYPGTRLFDKLKKEGRLLTENWDRYNTREVVFQPKNMTAEVLKAGYDEAYRSFYKWSSILRSSLAHADRPSHAVRQFCYSAGWKKFEPFWNAAIKLKRLGAARPLLETLLMTERSAATHPVKSQHCAPVKR